MYKMYLQLINYLTLIIIFDFHYQHEYSRYVAFICNRFISFFFRFIFWRTCLNTSIYIYGRPPSAERLEFTAHLLSHVSGEGVLKFGPQGAPNPLLPIWIYHCVCLSRRTRVDHFCESEIRLHILGFLTSKSMEFATCLLFVYKILS